MHQRLHACMCIVGLVCMHASTCLCTWCMYLCCGSCVHACKHVFVYMMYVFVLWVLCACMQARVCVHDVCICVVGLVCMHASTCLCTWCMYLCCGSSCLAVLIWTACSQCYCRFHLESESEYLLSQYRFTRKFVLRCTVSDIINNNNLTRLQRLKIHETHNRLFSQHWKVNIYTSIFN